MNSDNNIGSWKEDYLRYHLQKNSLNYIKDIKSVLGYYVVQDYCYLNAKSFSGTDAERVINMILFNPKVNSNGYVARSFWMIRQFFDYIVEHGGADHNHFRDMKTPAL